MTEVGREVLLIDWKGAGVAISSDEQEEEEDCSTVTKEMERKYLCDEDIDSSMLLNSMTGTSPCKLAIRRCLELLVLNHKFINTIGDERRFRKFCTNVREIDLAWNRLSSWNDIAIIMNLPNLEVLNLSHNPLSHALSDDLPGANRLKTLIINDTKLPFSTLKILVEKLPKLTELHLSENGEIEKLMDMVGTISETLQVAYFNRCEIGDWGVVLALRKSFPNITSLYLCENPITHVNSEHDILDEALMNGVNFLNLNKCCIDNWISIENLSKIDSLRDLRIQQIPLLNNLSNEERTHLVIGRMPLLNTLNGSTISEKMREDSERFFIRYYDDHDVKPAVYADLVLRHGCLEKLCDVDLTPKSHAVVSVICEETGYNGNLKIRLSQSVSTLMHTFEKLTNISHGRMRVFYVGMQSGCPFPQELRFPNQKLISLRIEDGDQFQVLSKTVVCRKRTRTKS